MTKKYTFAILSTLYTAFMFSQKIVKNGEFYFSWGYNTEWYTHSDIKVSQPSQNTNITFVDIMAHDHKGWDNELLKKQLTIPQYNYRIGYFFNQKQDWGIEINFDHTKYVVDWNKSVRVKGTLNGRSMDTMVVTGPGSIVWQLNNGANFLELNVVKRLKIIHAWNDKVKLDALLKLGGGPNVPHVQNAVFGRDNVAHFQFSGFNVDADAALRLTFFKHVFFEFYNKVVYARYWDLRLYDHARGRQAFGCYEIALSLGATFKL